MCSFVLNQKARFLHRFQTYFNRFTGNCQISTNVPKSTWIPHPTGIVIAKRVKMGENCTVFQNVTIGVKGKGQKGVPTIGNNVVVGAGAVIVGDIKIPDNTTVKANSLVVGK